MKGKLVMRRTIIAACLAALVAPAQADDREELEALRQTTLKLVEILVQSGILTKEKADEMLREARRSAQSSTAAAATQGAQGTAPRVVRVPYVPEMVRAQIKEEIRSEVMEQAERERWAVAGSVPDWTRGVKLSGDLRLRQQRVYQSKDNSLGIWDPNDVTADNTGNYINVQDDYSQSRLRLRLGVDFKLGGDVSGGARLATGSTSNPVSTNQTMGQNGNRYTVTLDRAFLKYGSFPLPLLPSSGFGATMADVVAGRIANPWLSTDLVWDEDLAFDGIAAILRPRLHDTALGVVTLGAFPLQDLGCDAIHGCSKDKRLYAGQFGFDYRPNDQQRLRAGLAYYEYQGITPEPDAFDDSIGTRTAPLGFRQKGNTSLPVFDAAGTANALGILPAYKQEAPVADFKLLNLTAVYETKLWDPLGLVFTADWVKNIGYDRAKVEQRLGYEQEERTKGALASMQFGYPKPRDRGDWNVSFGYKYLQRDAVLDSFTDSDFHLGGTNAKGWILGGTYGLARNTTFRMRWLTSNEIDGPELANDVLQLDLNASF
ncbi:MAG: putative porin [Rhodocyclales bacterium]|nr:putative porin [Rhodocyclales bacterium]